MVWSVAARPTRAAGRGAGRARRTQPYPRVSKAIARPGTKASTARRLRARKCQATARLAGTSVRTNVIPQSPVSEATCSSGSTSTWLSISDAQGGPVGRGHGDQPFEAGPGRREGEDADPRLQPEHGLPSYEDDQGKGGG